MSEQAKYITGSEWTKIVAKGWVDEEFRKNLEQDPINTIQNDPDVGVEFDRFLCLPSQPRDLTDEALSDISSGQSEAVVIPYTCICVCMVSCVSGGGQEQNE